MSVELNNSLLPGPTSSPTESPPPLTLPPPAIEERQQEEMRYEERVSQILKRGLIHPGGVTNR